MMIIQDRTSISSNLHLTVLVLALAIAGCSKPETQKSALPRPVRTITVAPQPIENSRTAVGDIRPRYESDLGFRVSGKITKRFVDVGASIRKGDLLAQLDDQDYRNRLTSAKTEVTTAQAVLVEAQAAEKRLRNLPGGNTTPANHDVALKNLRSAEAKLVSQEIIFGIRRFHRWTQISYLLICENLRHLRTNQTLPARGCIIALTHNKRTPGELAD